MAQTDMWCSSVMNVTLSPGLVNMEIADAVEICADQVAPGNDVVVQEPSRNLFKLPRQQ